MVPNKLTRVNDPLPRSFCCLIMLSSTVYQNDDLIRLRLLQRYMSAGIMSLVISRGGFFTSVLLLVTGSGFIVVGRFFFWERHNVYGCRPDYTTSVSSRACSFDWQRKARVSLDSSTLICLTSGAIAWLVALVYPYALVAVKGKREEAEELRSTVHLVYQSVEKTRYPSRHECEQTVMGLVGLGHYPSRWNYFHHPRLNHSLTRRRRYRRFAACLWTEVFARIVLEEHVFPLVVCFLILGSAAVAPSLMTQSSALLRICSVFVCLLSYVTILVVSLAAFAVILILDPTAWTACLAFWVAYLIVHLIGYVTHTWASRIPTLLVPPKLWADKIPPSLVQKVLVQLF